MKPLTIIFVYWRKKENPELPPPPPSPSLSHHYLVNMWVILPRKGHERIESSMSPPTSRQSLPRLASGQRAACSAGRCWTGLLPHLVISPGSTDFQAKQGHALPQWLCPSHQHYYLVSSSGLPLPACKISSRRRSVFALERPARCPNGF